MKFKEIQTFLERIAPLSYQESYDNSGLLLGDAGQEINGALICLDVTEEVLDEAIHLGYNAVIAHHPVIFKGIKRLTGSNYVERILVKAIKNDILLYAIHTNLDNVSTGVNRILGEKLGLRNLQILRPMRATLKKLITYAPLSHADSVRNALFTAGGGNIGNYDQCSFNVEGTGTFRANENAQPFVGQKGSMHREKELRIETVFPAFLQGKIISALVKSHPYEEVAYDIYSLENENPGVGAGMIGSLPEPVSVKDFLAKAKEILQAGSVKYAGPEEKKISKIAFCGGSGSFLISTAKAEGAELFLSGDITYHQFFEHENKMVIADIGHYETEQFVKELIFNLLIEKFPNFAARICTLNTNPVKYL